MNQHRRIGLTDAASFLLAIYYLWYQLPFMRATFQAERYKYLFFACFAAGILLLCAARLENCRMQTVPREYRRVIAYDVDYVYKGSKFRTRMGKDPGNRLRIRVSITPYPAN